MKARKLLALLIGLIFVFALTACGGATKDPSKMTVAGVVFQEDQFMKLLTAGYTDAAKAAGVKCLTGNTNNDTAKEVELINTYISQKVNGIAIAPRDSKTAEPVLKKADEKGIKIAITNTDLSSASYIVGGYTSDSKQIGETSGKAAHDFIKNKLGGKAKVAILQFKSQVPEQSTARVDGFKSALKDLGDGIEYVADQDAWLQDAAVQKAGDILTAHPEVNIIFAANDGGTIGATMAVKNAGKAGKCFVFGVDTGTQQIEMLKSDDNILQAITGQDPYNMGYKAMETLIKSIKGEDVTATKGKTIIVPGTLLSRDNPDGITKFETDLKAKIGG